MTNKNKKKSQWSKRFFQTLIGVWNCWSLSNERYDYWKELQYDILALTELHDAQAKTQYQGRRWVSSAPSTEDEEGKNSNPAADVAILLSEKMEDKIIDSGHVDTRIAWVRIAGPVCNIYFIVTYVPHKGRTKPSAKDTIKQLKELLKTIKKSECVVL